MSKLVKNKKYNLLLAYVLLAIAMPYKILPFLAQSINNKFIDILFLLLILVITHIVAKELYHFDIRVKKIALSAFFVRETWVRKILEQKYFFRIITYIVSFFMSSILFIFLNKPVHLSFTIVVLLDGVLMFWLIDRIVPPEYINNKLTHEAGKIAEIYIVNILNIIALYFGYIVMESFTGKSQILAQFAPGIDPNIPLWVKENLSHPSHFIQTILRVLYCIELTTDNIINNEISIRGVKLYTYYRIFQMFAVGLFPFASITLFYRGIFFMSFKKKE